jgi:hypothetical protein
MRKVQEDHMQDTGYRLVHSRSFNSMNEPIDTWTAEASSTKCGIEMKSGDETDKETMTLIHYDAILRLPIDKAIDPIDRFRLTSQNGETITSIDYEIVSPVQRGPSGSRILLKKVLV